MTHLSGIQIGRHARALAAALALGGALLALPVGQAEARPIQPKLCSQEINGTIHFFVPGDITWVSNSDGRLFLCTSTGYWREWTGSPQDIEEGREIRENGGGGRGRGGRGGR